MKFGHFAVNLYSFNTKKQTDFENWLFDISLYIYYNIRKTNQTVTNCNGLSY